jgi:hypothetical protein
VVSEGESVVVLEVAAGLTYRSIKNAAATKRTTMINTTLKAGW